MRRLVVYIAVLLFISCSSSSAQNGDYFIKNFLPKEYKGLANNFGTTQDDDGLIYVANDNAVLIFDGINWDKCSRHDEVTISCIQKTNSNKIVVGTVDGDIALIEKNKKGRFRYNSLLSNIPESQRPQEAIRQILTLGEVTYFLSADKLIAFKNSEFSYFNPIESFHTRAFVMGKHLFITELNNHISVLQNGVLTPLNETEELAAEKLFFCYPLSKTNYVLGYRNIGLVNVQYDSVNPAKSQFKKTGWQTLELLNDAEINNGTLLNDGRLVVTTNKNGAYIIDKNLTINKQLNTKSGIFDDNVKAAFQDHNGNLWLALYYGISFIEINSKVLKYNRESGIKGPVQSAAIYKQQLIIATDKGLQKFNQQNNQFEDIAEFKNQSWHIYPFKNLLFVSTSKGFFVFDGIQFKRLNEAVSRVAYGIGHFIYNGNETGFDIFELTNGTVRYLRTVELGSAVTSMISSKDGFYMGTTSNGVFHIGANQVVSKVRGLPHEDYEYSVLSYKNRLLIATDSGIYSPKTAKEAHKNELFNPLTRRSQVFRACEYKNGILYSEKYETTDKSKFEEKVSFIHLVNNTATKSVFNLHQLKDISTNLITYDSTSQQVYICANEGLYILKDVDVSLNKTYSLFLKNFISLRDTIYSNLSGKADFTSLGIDLPYQQNDITLQVGFNTFENSNVEFCYQLEGKDKSFSAWDKKSEWSLSNLLEGHYVFHVKARTELSDKIFSFSIPFHIMPPWYRSVWAYLIYALLFVGLVYVIVKLYSRRLREQNIKLEELVKQRTSVIEEQKIIVEHKQKEILDSINYAERIQRSFMASEQLLNKTLRQQQRDYFIFFKPKDVVSGDFYWAGHTSEGKFIFVAADSTGHGVPGAIMSLLNITSIEKALETEQEPNKILNATRKTIINRLKNDGSEEGGQDGMDCSICIFDFDKKSIAISTANNPVLLHQALTNELIEIKPDKIPVGRHERDHQDFTKQEIHFSSGDTLYLLSDGYADQFGGPSGKKFMNKKLKQFLQSIASKDMSVQKAILSEEFANWKGKLEQVDDVILVGIRL